MKRLTITLIFVYMVVLLCSCAKPATTPEPSMPATKTEEPKLETLTLNQVFTAFQEAKLPIVDHFVYDESNDPNKLLRRPNQYIEKVNFRDDRVKLKFKPRDAEQRDAMRECTIEVFANREDAEQRKQYTDAIGKSSSMFGSYSYLHKNVLVRLPFELTPTQAEDYKKVLEHL